MSKEEIQKCVVCGCELEYESFLERKNKWDEDVAPENFKICYNCIGMLKYEIDRLEEEQR